MGLKNKFKIIILVCLGMIFVGCTYKTTPVAVAFRRGNFAINDQGFLKQNSFSTKIEVYNLGELAFVMSINHDYICINKKCYNKKMFVHQLNPNYPSNLFDLIIFKKPIPNIPIQKTDNGFVQKTDNLLYKVTNNMVLFRDKQTHFLFLLKKK